MTTEEKKAAPKSGEGSQGVAHTMNVSANRRDNPLNTQENPEADAFIAAGKAKKAERFSKARAGAESAEGAPKTGTTSTSKARPVAKGTGSATPVT